MDKVILHKTTEENGESNSENQSEVNDRKKDEGWFKSGGESGETQTNRRGEVKEKVEKEREIGPEGEVERPGLGTSGALHDVI